MGIFGWSLPPGCNTSQLDQELPCDLCGIHTDNCECDECHTCGNVGDAACLENHGMTLSPEQIMIGWESVVVMAHQEQEDCNVDVY